MKLEATGSSDSKRIVDDSGNVIAMCERYTSGFWAVHDKNTDHRLCFPVHKTPTQAMKWFKETSNEHNGNAI